MYWLIIPASGAPKSFDLSNASQLLNLLCGLKSHLSMLEGKSLVEILDLLVLDLDKYADVLTLAALTKLEPKQVRERWEKLRSSYQGDQAKKLRVFARRFSELQRDEFKDLPRTVQWQLLEEDLNRSESPSTHLNFSLGALAKATQDLEALAKLPHCRRALMPPQGTSLKAIINSTIINIK